MVKTFGLTHINLAVRDLERSLRFYHEVFGVRELCRGADWIQAQTPGSQDVIAFERTDRGVGESGGISHFGFRLIDKADIDRAVDDALAAGGTLLRRGEFAPGVPYAYLHDPDGYEIEVWYE